MASPRSSLDGPHNEDGKERPNLGHQVERRMTETSQHETSASNLNDLDPDNALPDSQSTDNERSRRRSRIPPGRKWNTLFSQEVAQDRMLEAQLLLLTVSTGIQDATTFGDFNVFTTKMTGNTLFLALYALDSPVIGPQVEQNVGVAIASFIVGAAFFGHIGRKVRQRRRLWLVLMNLFQTLLTFAATAVRAWAPRSRTGGATLGIVALLSFASSGQIAMAVGVGLAELNTTMVTGTLVQLSSDRNFFHRHNYPRTRRVLFYSSLLIGCFIGAAARYRDAWLGLLLTASLKALISISFIFNRGIVLSDEGDKEKGAASGKATPISRILWGD